MGEEPWLARKFRKASYALRHAHTAPFYGFVQGHASLTDGMLREAARLVGAEQPDIVAAFETEFSRQAWGGQAVSFAAARMAFFALMKAIGIGDGDEVILPGATCAVMVTAVMRAGATPVFSDIDPETFGSASGAIKRCMTARTRMIVAQHSFGIPCDIEPIVSLAKDSGVFLLEDCALTLGSTWGGVMVGAFGDAALFSTDHSKPLNTMTGGLVVTRDPVLTERLRRMQADAAPLPAVKQRALWKRMLFERRFCGPQRYGSVALRDIYGRLTSRDSENPFLDQDFGVGPTTGYPYPARMPAFLAAVGIGELKRWQKTAAERKMVLRTLLAAVAETPAGAQIPRVYYDTRADIVPLRLAWSQEGGKAMRARLSRYIDTDWTWFMEPIVAIETKLEDYLYRPGSCPVSEYLGPNMINLPCNMPIESSGRLAGTVRDTLLEFPTPSGC